MLNLCCNASYAPQTLDIEARAEYFHTAKKPSVRRLPAEEVFHNIALLYSFDLSINNGVQLYLLQRFIDRISQHGTGLAVGSIRAPSTPQTAQLGPLKVVPYALIDSGLPALALLTVRRRIGTLATVIVILKPAAERQIDRVRPIVNDVPMRQKPFPSAARRIQIGFGQFHRTAGPTLRVRQLLWRQQGGTVPAAGGCARIRYFPAFLSNLADRTQRFRHLCERFSKLHVFGRRYTISDGLPAMLLLVLLLLRKLPSLHKPHGTLVSTIITTKRFREWRRAGSTLGGAIAIASNATYARIPLQVWWWCAMIVKGSGGQRFRRYDRSNCWRGRQ